MCVRTEMLFDGKAIQLSKGDSFTFYENEPSMSDPGNYVITYVEVKRGIYIVCRYKQRDCVEMFWQGIKFMWMTGCWLSQ